MPWSGTGVFNPTPAGYPAVGGTTILASFYNAMISDITGVGFANCITRDGQGKPSAQIDWNLQNLVNVQNLTVVGTATFSGGVAYSGAGLRFQADFSNATIASRFMFQTSTVNGGSSVGVIPNGTGPSSSWVAINNSNPTNSAYMGIGVSAAESILVSGIFGAGVYLPMTFYTNGLEQMRLNTAGNLGFGTTTPNYAGYGRALSIQSGTSALELASTTADADNTPLAGIEANYRTNSGGHNRVAAIQFFTDGATVNQRGGKILFFTKPDGSTTLTQRAMISSAGFFGIGMTPGTTLDITSATNQGIRITDGTVSGVFFPSSGPILSLGTQSNHGVAFITNNTQRAFLNAAGAFGIGATPLAGVLLQVHVATNRNLTITDSVSLAGSVVISGVNDAGTVNIPIEIRGTELAYYGAGTQYFAIGTTGDVTARGIAVVRTKTADTSRNTTTVLADDPDLTFALAANTNYEVRVHALFAGPLAAGMGADLQLHYTGTLVANNGKGTVVGPTTSFALVNTFAINSTIGITSVQTVQEQMDLTVSFRTNGAGTLSLQWAQHTSNGNNLTMYAGSSILITKLT
jgi:hypothetical protein